MHQFSLRPVGIAAGIISIIVVIIVIVFPAIIAYAIGIYLIIVGIMAVARGAR